MIKKSFLFIAFIAISVVSLAQADTSIFPLPKDLPKYPEGRQALEEFIQQNIVYPEYEKSKGIEGTVSVYCDVELDGTLSNFRIGSTVEGSVGFDAEAIRVCQKIGKFTPCIRNGKPICYMISIDVTFDLNNGDEMEMAISKLSPKEVKEIEKDAKDLCKMIDEIVELQVTGDTVKVNALSKTFEPRMAELQKKYPKGSVFEKKLEEFVKPCMEEAMKRYPNEQSEVQEEIKLSNREIKGIKKDAEYICDMMSKFIEAEKDNDQKKIESLTAEFDDKAAYLQKKYPKGSAMEKRLEDLVKSCIEEAMKAAMGK